MKVLLTTVGIGGQYPRLVARMIEQFYVNSFGFELRAWVNTLPPGAPENVIVNGYDYTGYCAKPFALAECRRHDADVVILMDASFYPIRPIHPLIDHICQTGYYFCANGFSVGSWCQDSTLGAFGLSREESFDIPEISGYCVGLHFHYESSHRLLDAWCQSWPTFPGPHTNVNRASEDPGFPDRNPGWCSDDPRVNGHRHDQTALSVIAHRLGMNVLVERPMFTTYSGLETKDTVLVNKGGI